MRSILPALVLAAATAGAQQPASPPGPAAPPAGLLLGRVVDAASGSPIAHAVVSLTASQASPSAPFPPATSRVLTDADGDFVFNSLPPARYSIAASQFGYLDGAYGRTRPGGSVTPIDLGDNERLGDLTIALWNYATIGGTITDEAGEPVVGISVHVLHRQFAAGHALLGLLSTTGTTDDRGEYRIGGLEPGEYLPVVTSTSSTFPVDVIVAIGQTGMTDASLRREMFHVAPSIAPLGMSQIQVVGNLMLTGTQRSLASTDSPDAPRISIYPTTFYPSSPTLPAQMVDVRAGDARTGLDIRLALAPAGRVTGRVDGPSGPVVHTAVRLITASADRFASDFGIETATALTDELGVFTLLGVPPGTYMLRMERMPDAAPGARDGMPAGIPDAPALWANEPVTVGDSDITDLVVRARPAVRVSGRFVFAGSSRPPAPAELQRVPIVIESADGRSVGHVDPGHGDANGGFTTFGVPPGRYLVRVGGAPAGWTVESATIGGKDAIDTPVDLTADADDAVVTFTDRPTDLAGSVRNADGGGAIDAAVLIFPSERSAWTSYGGNGRRVRDVRATRAGTYDVTGLPAGSYFVVAVADADTGRWPDPAYLEVLSRGATLVTLQNGDRKTQDLRISRGQ